jgi:localization factor PodJL
VETLSERLEQARAGTQQQIQTLDMQHAGSAKALAGQVETLSGKLGQVRTDIQQRLQSMDARYGDTARALAVKIESLTGKLEDAGTEASTARTALGQQIAAAQRMLEQMEQRRADIAQNLEAARQREEATSSAVLDLQSSVSELKSRFADFAADSRFLALERSLAQLAGRSETTENNIASLQAKTGAVDDLLKALDARFESDARKQQETLTELKTSLLGQTSQALSERFEAESRKQQDAFAELRTGLLGQTSQALGERFDTESRKQQDALTELKSSLLDQLSRTLNDRLDTDERKQTEALQQLHANLVADALKSFGDKLETESSKQQQAIADLKASLTPPPAEPLVTAAMHETESREATTHEITVHDAPERIMTAKDDSSAQEAFAHNDALAYEPLQHDAPPHEAADGTSAVQEIFPQSEAPAHEPLPQHALSHEVAEALPPVVAQEAHDEILELDAPVISHTQSDTPNEEVHEEHHEEQYEERHEDVHSAEAVHPAFAQQVFPTGAAPAMALAHDDASAQAAADPASFLSAARQTLQAASQKTDIEGNAKDLFGLPFMRAGGGKGKSETTSYALLAGVVLVAIVAVAVTAGELISRSAPTAPAHPASIVAPAPKLAAVVHAVAKTAAVAAAKPASAASNTADGKRQLTVLAKAGDSQAEMLLGLQQLNGPNKEQAIGLLARAAASGEPVAQYRLATIYGEGHGVAPDPAKAFHWYVSAAQSGNRKAMSNLALAYAQGSGTTKNPVEAARWFSKAAQLGLVDAQFDLAVLYERGLGVPQSLMDAYRWYLIAAKSGDKESKDRIEALGSQLLPVDRAAAETAAAQFKPQPMNARANEPQ